MELTTARVRGVLGFLVEGQQVCVPWKLKRIGAGKRNGYGGGIDGDETEQAAMCREIGEEAKVSVDVRDVEHVGLIEFHNHREDGGVCVAEISVFLIRAWCGHPEASEEMGRPEWFPVDALPVDEMMSGDRFWLPLVFSLKPGEYVRGEVHYSPGQEKVLFKPIVGIKRRQREAS